MAKIETIEGVGPALAKKFQRSEYSHLRTSTRRRCNQEGSQGSRQEHRSRRGQDPVLRQLRRSHAHQGVGSEFSELLERAGVDTVKELKGRRPDNLTAKMAEVNAASIKKSKKSIVRRLPSEKEVVKWVAQAKKLPAVVKY